MKIGVLTGGGDAPGLNAAIRGVARKDLPLPREAVSGILPRGGTILGTSRTNPYKREDGVALAKRNFKELGLNAQRVHQTEYAILVSCVAKARRPPASDTNAVHLP